MPLMSLPFSSNLPFRFAQCVVASLQTDGVFSYSSSSPASPTLAYLDLGATASRRNLTIKMSRTQIVPNPPVARLQQMHKRRLQPTSVRTAKKMITVDITSPKFKVHLLALPATNARTVPKGLYFYTALIPQAFLGRFNHPSRYFPCDPILISYYRIPLRPEAEMVRAMGCVISAIRNSTALCDNSGLVDISF
ncbi:hypothetical protein QBC46DRAFT_401922 [Diplogelasinospora grovesii]|uniref:Uncharacterized protein n=1 Tax=Diplogelasinospora grovesii TaxID=303347 RepID=A0AAN6RYU5_9PEZI|nr:hypothetical protein QBC46DRAFT_401922 [Diplogelasinospora grovesii]